MKDELFADRIYSHEPIYIVGGNRPEWDLKYQISFKVQLTDRFFLGYSQMNHWDVAKASSPFRDTMHRPSFFWYGPSPSPPPEGASGLERLAFHYAVGYEHTSNGRDATESRSMDRLFAKATGYYGHPDDTHGRVSVKAYTYVGKGAQNRDIADYRRYFDFEATSLYRNSLGVGWTHYYGRDSKGANQLDTTYALRELGIRAPGFLYLQVFRGYGETLLDYNRKGPTQYRIGYMIERGTGRSDKRFSASSERAP